MTKILIIRRNSSHLFSTYFLTRFNYFKGRTGVTAPTKPFLEEPTFMESGRQSRCKDKLVREVGMLLITSQNHRFRMDKSKKLKDDKSARKYWRCTNTGCKSRYVTTEDWYCSINVCQHPANAAKIAVEKVIQEVGRQMTSTTGISTRDARGRIAAELKDDVLRMEISKIKTLSRRLNRISKKAVVEVDNTPFSFESVRTKTGKKFLLERLDEDDRDTVILSSPDQLAILKDATVWAMDGTFSTLPVPWKQLYIIHGFKGEGESLTCFPLVYILMKRRCQNDYLAIFKVIINRLEGSTPHSVIIDQELAVRNALTKLMPDAKVFLCWFHFKQAIFRKIKSLGLAQLYNAEYMAAHLFKSYAALAFLKPEHISIAFDELVNRKTEDVDLLKKYNLEEKMREFDKYFEDQYVGRLRSTRTESGLVTTRFIFINSNC